MKLAKVVFTSLHSDNNFRANYYNRGISTIFLRLGKLVVVMTTDNEFYIADWFIEPSVCQISRGEKSIRLEPKVMDLLVYMSDRPGDVLSRDEIQDNVWQGTVIGYDALTNAIIKLRKALDDSARNPQIIDTVPKKGYRLIAEVSFPDPETSPDEQRNLERKLTAILYSDIVGYSRLTEQDEEGTHQLVSAYLDAMSQAIVHHNGKVVHYAGDAVLADFSTVIDALSCAADIQRDLAARNARQAADRVVQFRIGINLGDVIVDRDDIYGEGVNAAARLESLADPGGICISESVRSTAGHKLPFAYEFLGEQTVKNIAEPIRAYRVLLDPGAAASKPVKSVRWQMAAAIIILVLVVTALTLFVRDRWAVVPQIVEPEGLALPDTASIAVLPFVNTGNEAEYSYFSDGITDDLITDLSSISDLLVIARNSTFQYKGKAVDVKKVARDLGVHYVLEGSVRRSGDRVRVNTQLIDGVTGGQIWAERYDGELKDVFNLQDRITEKIISALALKLTDQDQANLASAETTNPAAYDEYLKGLAFRWTISRESFAQAEKHFLKALEFDPDFARAHASLALLYFQSSQQNWHENSGSQTAGWVRARRELDAAMVEPTPLAFSLRSTMYLHNRRFEKAIADAERAISLNPGNATGFLALAEALSFSGKSTEAIENAKKALRRDPNFPAPYLFVEGRALFDLQRYAESIAVLERAVAANPGNYSPLIFILASHGLLEQPEDAQETLKQLNALLKKDRLSEFTLSKLSNRWPYADRASLDHLKSGLIRAEVPEW